MGLVSQLTSILLCETLAFLDKKGGFFFQPYVLKRVGLVGELFMEILLRKEFDNPLKNKEKEREGAVIGTNVLTELIILTEIGT